MENKVSVIDAETYSYSDNEKIEKAVNTAILQAIGDLTEIIHPGMTVLIKPNLVMDKNHNEEGGTDCLYTQAVVVRPVLKTVLQCLRGNGKVYIGDAPMQECVFENLSGYAELVEEFRNDRVEIELVDFRELKSVVKNGMHYAEINPGANGKIVNLGSDSEFYGVSDQISKRFRITNYDPRILPTHHHGDVQEYYVSDYVLQADVIISMPKPKSHRKGGVTAALKNNVGINVRKEFLPHHTLGSADKGGDEYYKSNVFHKLQSFLFDKKNTYEADKKFKKAKLLKLPLIICTKLMQITGNRFSEGSWYGNDTISRTIVDLNRAVLYADKNGMMQPNPQRKILFVADMIVSGEKEGPVCPSPKPVGFIIAGTNPVFFDQVVGTLMGFDIEKIPTLKRAAEQSTPYPLCDSHDKVRICSNLPEYDNIGLEELKMAKLLYFEPTSGWKGHIELEQ